MVGNACSVLRDLLMTAAKARFEYLGDGAMVIKDPQSLILSEIRRDYDLHCIRSQVFKHL